jgi:hypothetical protein
MASTACTSRGRRLRLAAAGGSHGGGSGTCQVPRVPARAGPHGQIRHPRRHDQDHRRRQQQPRQLIGGYADPAAPAARGFLLAKGVTGPFTPVDVPGAATTMAFGIDDHGRVVGGYQNPDATPSPQPAATPLGRTA